MKSYRIIGLVGLIVLSFKALDGAQILPTLDEQKKLTLQLEEDEVAIFGYGSLMLEETLHCADQDVCDSRPYVMARLNEFKRSWSVQYPNDENFQAWDGLLFKPQTKTCLNIERAQDSKVNGMLFVCSKAELESYDEREFPYDRIEISDLLEDVAVVGGKAYAYTAKPAYFRPSEELSSDETVIDSYYVFIIEYALKRLGKDFEEEYYKSTQPVPDHLVFDYYWNDYSNKE